MPTFGGMPRLTPMSESPTGASTTITGRGLSQVVSPQPSQVLGNGPSANRSPQNEQQVFFRSFMVCSSLDGQHPVDGDLRLHGDGAVHADDVPFDELALRI